MRDKPLRKEYILEGLKGSRFSEIILLDTVESTNEIGKDLASKGAKDGTVVIAEEQSAGKGRKGRRWLSKKYANLLFSIILRPEIEKDFIFALNMAISVSFIEAIEELLGIHAVIKWPNDIYINNKKVAGILTEFFLKDSRIDYVIIGMGINVNWFPKDSELLYPATSLSKEKGEYIDREPILVVGLNKFSKYYDNILNRLDELYEKWNRRCIIIGKEVSVISNKEEFKGIALKVEKDGSLILRVNGKEKRIIYGDVSLR